MEFKKWLEGFGVDYTKLPSGLHPHQFDPESIKTRGKKKREMMDLLKQPSIITFDPVDRPEDFIKVQTINLVKPIPLEGVGKRLPSFRGDILYAFKFNAAENLIIRYFSEQMKFIKSNLEEARNKLKNIRRSADYSKQVVDIIRQSYEEVRKKVISQKQIEKYVPDFVYRHLRDAGLPTTNKDGKPWTWDRIERVLKSAEFREKPPESEPEEEEESEEWPKEWPRWERKKPEKLQSMGKSALQNLVKKLSEELKELEEKVATRGHFASLIEQTFLKKIKFPETQEDLALQARFIELSVRNYINFRPNFPYDYVVYPESRSDLNSKVANRLAKNYNCPAVKGFTKLALPELQKK